MKDRIQTLDSFNDLSPLTEETLKELGFKYEEDQYEQRYVLDVLKNPYIELAFAKDNKDAGELGYMFRHSEGYTSFYKTVGALKMLIEALRGE